MPLLRNAGLKPVHVTLHGRKFIVRFSQENEPMRISERKITKRFGVDLAYNAVYWNTKNHKLGAEWTLPQRIIAAAREKL